MHRVWNSSQEKVVDSRRRRVHGEREVTPLGHAVLTTLVNEVDQVRVPETSLGLQVELVGCVSHHFVIAASFGVEHDGVVVAVEQIAERVTAVDVREVAPFAQIVGELRRRIGGGEGQETQQKVD